MRLYEQLPEELKTKFSPKKKQSRKLANVYKRIGLHKRYKIVSECANTLVYDTYDDGSVHLSHCLFCKDFLCPLCAWRKEIKMFHQVSRMVDVLQSQQYNFVFVTLTIRNVENSGKALSNVLDQFNAAYTRLLRLQKIKRIVKGAFRSIEVTYNPITDEFHPHIHSIWVVPKGYFQSHDFLKQKELCELWKNCLDVDYTPICDIRSVTGKKMNRDGKTVSYDLKSAVAETCKYSVKSCDYLKHSDEVNEKVIRSLVEGLARRRLFSFYGVFADVRRDLDFDDVDDGDLIHVTDDRTSGNLLFKVYFRWDNKQCKYINYHVVISIDIPIDDELLSG